MPLLRKLSDFAGLLPALLFAAAQPAQGQSVPSDSPTIVASDQDLDPDEEAKQPEQDADPATAQQDADEADDTDADAPDGPREVSSLPADWKPYWSYAPGRDAYDDALVPDIEQLKLLAEQVPPEEEAPFAAFMGQLSRADTVALLAVTRELRGFGQRGLFVKFLSALPKARQTAMIDLIKDFTTAQAYAFARELEHNPRPEWMAVPDLLDAVGPKVAVPLLFGNVPCELPRDKQVFECAIPPQAGPFFARWRIFYAPMRYRRVKAFGFRSPEKLSAWQAQIFRSGDDARPLSRTEVDAEIKDYGAPLENYQRWHLCGGALIEPGWVLTAAHCITPPNTNGNVQQYMANRSVRLGTRSIAALGGTEWRIEGVVRHSRFSLRALDKGYDIALLRIVEPRGEQAANPAMVVRPRPIRPAVPGALATVPDKTAYVTGWGFTEQADRTNVTRANNGKAQVPSAVLQAAKLAVLDNDQCNHDRQFIASRYQVASERGQLCAGSNGLQSSCRGDSGGPLVANVDKSPILVGLVSLGIGCGRKNAPSVFTDVAFFKDWIREAKAHYKRGQVSQWP